MLKYVIPALAALSLAAAAQANETDTTTVSVSVRYSDLDLASGAGMATLQSRIAGAVKAVCGRPDSRDLHALGDWQKCRTQAMEGAVQQLANARVNMPTLALAAS